MHGPPKYRRPSFSQRFVTRAFQRYWRLSRGHRLRAEVLIWGQDDTLLVSRDGALPGTDVKRHEAAEAALCEALGLAPERISLVAMLVQSSPDVAFAAHDTHIAVFECSTAEPASISKGYDFTALDHLEGKLAPAVLTIARRRRRQHT